MAGPLWRKGRPLKKNGRASSRNIGKPFPIWRKSCCHSGASLFRRGGKRVCPDSNLARSWPPGKRRAPDGASDSLSHREARPRDPAPGAVPRRPSRPLPGRPAAGQHLRPRTFTFDGILYDWVVPNSSGVLAASQTLMSLRSEPIFRTPFLGASLPASVDVPTGRLVLPFARNDQLLLTQILSGANTLNVDMTFRVLKPWPL